MKKFKQKKSQVFLGIGANLGDRLENFKKALELLKKNPAVTLQKISSIFETEPIGLKDQPLFLNAVLQIETDLAPKELLNFTQSIENQLGRVCEITGGPRPIDLDIIFYEDLIISEDDLVIPHPLMVERAFVLVPLEELAPDFIHPVLGLTVAQLAAVAKVRQAVRLFQKDIRV